MLGKSPIISNYVACFIDLLGQTNTLLKYPIMPSHRDEDFNNWMKDTFGFVKMFRSSFCEYFSSFNDYEPSHPKYKQYKKHNLKMMPISDSILIYSTLYEQIDYIPILDIHSLFCACSISQLLFLSVGKPFRGAIDIGIGLETEEVGFYGSVIPKVVELEKDAVYPISIVGDNIIDYLNYFSEYQYEGKDNEDRNILNNSFSKAILDEIIIDFEGKRMLHFLSEYFLKVANNAGSGFKDMGIKAYDFINKAIDDFQNDQKLLKKYSFLKKYFDEYITVWIK